MGKIKKTKKVRRLRPATELVHGGILRSQFGENAEAIFMTQSYVYDSAEQAERRFKGDEPGFIYSRYANPTVAMFEERMRLLEGAEMARATASGMAAVTSAFLCHLKAGDHVVAAKALFGSCRYVVEDLLPRYGMTSTLVDGTDLSQWRRAVKKGRTRALFLESPTNPTLEIIDIAAVAEIAHAAGARLIVDNVFATPLLQRPLALGADVVVYSATKHVDGQGRSLGGIILADKTFVMDHLHTFLRQTGPSLSPFNAWLLLKGLETLPVRVERQSATAAALADRLAAHPQVSRVLYPGRADHPQHDLARRQMSSGSTMIAFEVRADARAPSRWRMRSRSSAFPTTSATPRAWSPTPRPPPTSGSAKRRARSSASRRECCDFPSGWKTWTTLARIWTGRSIRWAEAIYPAGRAD